MGMDPLFNLMAVLTELHDKWGIMLYHLGGWTGGEL